MQAFHWASLRYALLVGGINPPKPPKDRAEPPMLTHSRHATKGKTREPEQNKFVWGFKPKTVLAE